MPIYLCAAAKFKLDLMRGYLKVGDIQGNPHQGNLGDPAGARQNYEKAASIAETLGPRERKDPGVRALVAQCEGSLGDLLGPGVSARRQSIAIPRHSRFYREIWRHR
jgi:hypothetical protein